MIIYILALIGVLFLYFFTGILSAIFINWIWDGGDFSDAPALVYFWMGFCCPLVFIVALASIVIRPIYLINQFRDNLEEIKKDNRKIKNKLKIR